MQHIGTKGLAAAAFSFLDQAGIAVANRTKHDTKCEVGLQHMLAFERQLLHMLASHTGLLCRWAMSLSKS